MPKVSLATMRSKSTGDPWSDLTIPLTWAVCLLKGMTKTQLCQEAGISIGATGAWDRGIRLPSRRMWAKISCGKSYEEMQARQKKEIPHLPLPTTSSDLTPQELAELKSIPPGKIEQMVTLEAVTEDLVARMKPEPEEDAWDTF